MPSRITQLLFASLMAFMLVSFNGSSASSQGAEPAQVSAPPPPAPGQIRDVSSLPWLMSGGPIGANFSGVVVSPAYNIDHTVFGFNSFAGIYRTTDSGVTWSSVNSGLIGITLDVRGLVISPYFPGDNTVFVATARGVFRSTDRGLTWTQVNSGLNNLEVKSIAISPIFNTDRKLFVGTDGGGVFVSTNAGASWAATSGAVPDGQIWTLGIPANFANLPVIYAGGAFGGLYRTCDGGQTWLSLSSFFNNLWVRSIGVVPFQGNSLAVAIGTAFNGIVIVADSVCGSPQGSGSVTILQDFTHAEGGAPDAGISTAQINSIVFSPDFIHDSLIFVSTPPITNKAPVQWARLRICGGNNPRIALEAVCDITVKPGDGNTPPPAVISGTYNEAVCGTISYVVKVTHTTGTTQTYPDAIAISTDGGQTFPTTLPLNPPNAQPLDACGLFIGIPAAPSTNSAGNDQYLFTAAPKARFWLALSMGLDKNHDVRGLGISPNYTSDGILFSGTWGDGSYRLANAVPTQPAGTWVQPAPQGDSSAARVASLVRNIATVGGSNPARIYATTEGDGLFRCILPFNQAAQCAWVSMTPAGPPADPTGLPYTNRVVRSVVAYEIVPGVTDRVIIGTVDLSGNSTMGGVWRADISQTTLSPTPVWSNIGSATNGLPAPDIRSLAMVHPSGGNGSTDVLVAGTGNLQDGGASGVYVSFNGGASWTQHVQNLNDSASLSVRSVVISPAWSDPTTPDQRIVIGTDSGVWIRPPDQNGLFNPIGSWVQTNANLFPAGTPLANVVSLSPNFNGRNSAATCAATPTACRMFTGIWGRGFYAAQYPGDIAIATTSWTAHNSGLGGLYPRAIIPSATYPTDGNIFVATTAGLYQSANGGVNWFSANLGFDVSDIYSLGIINNTYLFAGTGGRGVWSLSAPLLLKQIFVPITLR